MIQPFLGIPELKSLVTRKSKKVPHNEVMPSMPISNGGGITVNLKYLLKIRQS
jgi:hypothetical protein